MIDFPPEEREAIVAAFKHVIDLVRPLQEVFAGNETLQLSTEQLGVLYDIVEWVRARVRNERTMNRPEVQALELAFGRILQAVMYPVRES